MKTPFPICTNQNNIYMQEKCTTDYKWKLELVVVGCGSKALQIKLEHEIHSSTDFSHQNLQITFYDRNFYQ